MPIRNPLTVLPPVPRAISQQVVFCDFDGPIVDVSERYYQTYLKGLTAVAQVQDGADSRSLRLQPLPKSQFWQMKQNRVADAEIAALSGLPDDLFKPFMRQVERLVNHASLLQWDCIQPTAQSALAHLQQCGLRLVIVTLRHPRQVQAFLQAQGLVDLVDAVYGATDINAAYANRVAHKCKLLETAIAQQTAQGHLTQGSWMIGDTEADVLAGQAMGLPTAALSCGVRSETYLRQLGPSEVYGCLSTAARDVVTVMTPQVA